jgi:hypothetical protein
MVTLRDRLVHDLDVDPPRGLMAWVRGSPLAHAQAAVRGKEADAVPVVEALLADARSSARLRRNAVPLYAHLLLVTAPAPTAAELYDARRQGKPIDPYRRRRDAMLALVDDEDVEVAIAAASALLEGADPGELPALRLSLARVLPLMRERRFESPQVQQALVALGGLPDALAWLEQLASQSGPLPPDLELLVAALDREGHAAAAPGLRRIFGRLDAVREPHAPSATPLAGGIRGWDGATVQALQVLGASLRLAAVDEAGAATALLAQASPALAAVLIEEVAASGDRIVALARAAGADGALAAPVREAAVRRLGAIAAAPAEPARASAAAALERLRADETVGAAAGRALAASGVARS